MATKKRTLYMKDLDHLMSYSDFNETFIGAKGRLRTPDKLREVMDIDDWEGIVNYDIRFEFSRCGIGVIAFNKPQVERFDKLFDELFFGSIELILNGEMTTKEQYVDHAHEVFKQYIKDIDTMWDYDGYY